MRGEVTYREAIAYAIADEMADDDRVFLIGEDVGAAGGAFKTVDGLFQKFGARRVRDTPIAEQAIVGCAIGAALRGLRPVAEIMFADFAGVCFDQIGNQLAKYRYMTGGRASVPVTIRMANGAGSGFAAQHSQPAENWFLNIAGLRLVTPGTPRDMYGMLRSAIRAEDPVLVFEHKGLLNTRGAVGDLIALGSAEVVRSGTDITVVATQLMRARAEQAAVELASESDVSLELIDPRTIAPFDMETISKSVRKTGRIVCVQEGQAEGSWGAALIAALLETEFESFDAPPRIVGGDATPVPYAAELEDAWLPSVSRIKRAIGECVAY